MNFNSLYSRRMILLPLVYLTFETVHYQCCTLNHVLRKCDTCPFVQLEEMAIEMFESIMQQDNIPIDMSSAEEPMSFSDYLESWRIKVWDTAYAAVFKGADSFKSLTLFELTRVQPFM